MRTPSIIIERVAHWLEFFTLAELVFVLSEDARMYPLDKFPIEKIALAVRHTFSSEQSNNDVKMLIEDLSMSYCQTRPLVKPTSISFIKIRHNNHLLVPFRSSCPTCYQNFNEWAWYQFPRLLSCFIYLWTNNRAIIEPCDKHCSQCLIVDGHQKCRRRICAFKDVQVNTEEMSNLVIGCCRTPATASRYCTLHDIRTTTENLHQSETRIRRKNLPRKKFHQYYNNSKKG
ncbi:unnamed protein product [Rotaria magnacalcarata]|uniref:Uncharacterized protein n=1 Tax=Rotaria magnacalcarata TaxID=392030 RepID=A0A8S3A5B9_9BILA|nr:unnamed protein product [Rotaria magnacalcarata]